MSLTQHDAVTLHHPPASASHVGSAAANKTLAREGAINVWAESITSVESVLLNAASNDIISINGLGQHSLTQRHLRRFCVKFRISGYKNKKRKETMQLIVRRTRSEAVEKMLYPEDDTDISGRQGANATEPETPSPEDGDDMILMEGQQDEEEQQRQPGCLSSATSSIASASLEQLVSSSPITRSMTRVADELGAAASSKAKKEEQELTSLICDTSGYILSGNQCLL